jgi:hypothetical protein
VDDEVITSQHWRVLLRAIVTDAALCTFRHEGRKPDIRCSRSIYSAARLKRPFNLHNFF